MNNLFFALRNRFLTFFFLAAFSSYAFCSNIYYHAGCSILDEKRKLIRQYAGTYCAFLPDGSLLQYLLGQKKLSRLDRNGLEVWHRNLMVHHQIKVTKDMESVYTLTAEVINSDLCKVRHDILEILDLKTGTTKFKWHVKNHISEFSQNSGYFTTYFARWGGGNFGDYNCEVTHVNSIDEIAENSLSKKIDAFSEGNFIVNLQGLQHVIIMDKKLKSVLWKFFMGMDHDAHDVQVLSSGEILSYNNRGNFLKNGILLKTLNPETKLVTWQFPEVIQKQFIGPSNGGVQMINNKVLFNANSQELGGLVHMIDKRTGHEIWNYAFEQQNEAGVPFILQEVKQENLTQFLNLNKL